MSKKTILCLIAFIAGVGTFYVTNPFFLNPKQLTGFALIFFALHYLLHKKTFKITLIIFLFFTLGFLRSYMDMHTAGENNIDFYNDSNKYMVIVGSVCDEPDRRLDKLKLTICTKQIISPVKKEVSGKILINTEKYPDYKFGDVIQVSGFLETPGEFNGFSYQDYLYRYQIYSMIYRPYIEYIGTSFRSNFSALYEIKRSFEEKLNQVYPEPYGSFMAGLITGSRKGIPEKLTSEFATTGLSHIVAISGYNITILVTVIMALLRPIGKRRSIIISALTVIAFTIAVGASAAVVRACIMGLISLLALNYGRKGNITITLLVAASIMMLINPRILIYDVGFQLSFLATAGLIYVSPMFEKWIKWIPNLLGFKEGLMLTIAAQITTLPIILMNFERLSMVSPLANMLIGGPFIPFAMLFGFLAGITGYFSIVIAKYMGFIGYLSLSYIIKIVELTAHIPHASIDITWFQNNMLIIYYALLLLVIFLYWRKKSTSNGTLMVRIETDKNG